MADTTATLLEAQQQQQQRSVRAAVVVLLVVLSTAVVGLSIALGLVATTATRTPPASVGAPTLAGTLAVTAVPGSGASLVPGVVARHVVPVGRTASILQLCTTSLCVHAAPWNGDATLNTPSLIVTPPTSSDGVLHATSVFTPLVPCASSTDCSNAILSVVHSQGTDVLAVSQGLGGSAFATATSGPGYNTAVDTMENIITAILNAPPGDSAAQVCYSCITSVFQNVPQCNNENAMNPTDVSTFTACVAAGVSAGALTTCNDACQSFE